MASAPSTAPSAARRDLVLLAALVAATAALCVHFNVSEDLFRWTRPLERFQVDELPLVLLVSLMGLAWFAARRHAEMQRELARRRAAEVELEAVLAQNRHLAQRYVQSQEAERKALACDLHDELGQYLHAIQLDAVSIAQRAGPDRPAIQAIAAGMGRNIEHVLRVVRGLIRQLRPPALDELGLAAALELCVEDWRLRLAPATIGVTVHGSLQGLAEPLMLVLLRLVQEAITNVARHARASRVSIRIARGQGPGGAGFTLEIADNGVGADLRAPTAGLGLIGMRERLAAVGGALTLISTPGQGFTVQAYLPAAAPADSSR
jgi:signal transduction histidine kinase